MPKAEFREFEYELESLFATWTYSLKAHFWPKKGKARLPSKVTRQHAIERMQAVVQNHFFKSPDGKHSLRNYDLKGQWHPKKGKGHGTIAKAKNFKSWYDEKIGTKNCVYLLWAGKKCLYVGRTTGGRNRPTNHFDKFWFSRCSRIDVYGFRGGRNVAQFECLMTHRYEPTRSRKKPSARHYSSNCPVCANDQFIAARVAALFPLRKRKRRKKR